MLVTLPPTLLQQCRERLKMFGFHPSFSRHGITRASSVLLIWLNENVGFHPSFSRHGITRASSVLLIWLNENVGKKINLCVFFIVLSIRCLC